LEKHRKREEGTRSRPGRRRKGEEPSVKFDAGGGKPRLPLKSRRKEDQKRRKGENKRKNFLFTAWRKGALYSLSNNNASQGKKGKIFTPLTEGGGKKRGRKEGPYNSGKVRSRK